LSVKIIGIFGVFDVVGSVVKIVVGSVVRLVVGRVVGSIVGIVGGTVVGTVVGLVGFAAPAVVVSIPNIIRRIRHARNHLRINTTFHNFPGISDNARHAMPQILTK